MRRNNLRTHIAAATLALAGLLFGYPAPLLLVAMFYVGVLIRRHS